MTGSSFKPANQNLDKFCVEPRSIIGTQQFFNQGYMMKYHHGDAKKLNRRQTTRFDNSFKFKRRMTMMDKEQKNRQSQTQLPVSRNAAEAAVHTRAWNTSTTKQSEHANDTAESALSRKIALNQAEQPIRHFEFKSESVMSRRYVNHSEGLNDSQLERLVAKMQTLQHEAEEDDLKVQEQSTLNMKNFLTRDQKKLKNYMKYCQIWDKNITRITSQRNRLNNVAFSVNAKFNKQQYDKGDVSILERSDENFEAKKNRDLLNVAIRPSYDHGDHWHCSLRQTEHDTEYDGIIPLNGSPEAGQTMDAAALAGQTSRSNLNESAHLSSREMMSMLNSKKNKTQRQFFSKKRQTYDQVFISEDDLPVQKRRNKVEYYSCTNSQHQSPAPNHIGKFVYKQRIPNLQQEVISKTVPFKTNPFCYNRLKNSFKYNTIDSDPINCEHNDSMISEDRNLQIETNEEPMIVEKSQMSQTSHANKIPSLITHLAMNQVMRNTFTDVSSRENDSQRNTNRSGGFSNVSYLSHSYNNSKRRNIGEFFI